MDSQARVEATTDRGAELVVNSRLRIPLAELRFEFSRSSGPGGQNVNKTSTRVAVLFDVSSSPVLTPIQRARLRARLSTRIGRDGVLRVTASRERTQTGNRRAALEQLAALLADALRVRKPRIRTKVPKHAIARRRQDKAHRSRVKSGRGTRSMPDD